MAMQYCLKCPKHQKQPYTKLDKDEAWTLIWELYDSENFSASSEHSTRIKELKEEYEDCDIAWAQSMMKVIDRMIGIGIRSRNYKRRHGKNAHKKQN